MDIQNANNWHLVSEGTLNVQYIDSTNYYKIKPVTITVSSPRVSVLITPQSPVRPNWHTGAYVQAYLTLPVGRSKIGGRRRCELGKRELFEFNFYGSVPYELDFEFPYWIQSLSYNVWEFADKNLLYIKDPALQLYLEGEEVTLTSGTSQQLPNGNWVMEFVEPVRFDSYQVKYYTNLDESILVNSPVFITNPKQLTARFYATQKIYPNQVKVKVSI